jgi:hypothetical protein
MSGVPENRSKFGPPIRSNAADERQRLIESNERFAQRLERAIARGKETPAGVRATVAEPAGFFPWRFNRTRGVA